MRPTDKLRDDHKAIKIVLRVIDKIARDADSGKETSADDLEQIIDFIRTFADKFHHIKEEDLLFPAMEKSGIPREGGPIGVMLMEHDQGRAYVRTAAETLPEYKSGNKAALTKITSNLRNFANLLAPHID